MAQTSLTCTIRKVDDAKRIALGFIEVTSANGQPVTDHELDQLPIDEFETAVNKSFGSGGLLAGENHVYKIGRVVQALTVSKAEREALGFGPGPEGLALKMYVADDDTWSRVKSGELSEFSIHGTAIREAA